jgi:hypothetical protein
MKFFDHPLALGRKPAPPANLVLPPPTEVPKRSFDRNFILTSWWSLLENLLLATIDDADSLRAAAKEAGAMVATAAKIADAAIDAFEKRWVE